MAGIQAMNYVVMAGMWVATNVIVWSAIMGKPGIIYGTVFAVGWLYATY